MSTATCCDYSRYRSSHKVLSVGCPALLFFIVNFTSTLIKYTHITFTLICQSPGKVSGTVIYSSTAVFASFYINLYRHRKKWLTSFSISFYPYLMVATVHMDKEQFNYVSNQFTCGVCI